LAPSRLDEHAGGFDGYWSSKPNDGHEDGLKEATRQMLGVDATSAGWKGMLKVPNLASGEA
jgi:hypothetical protein